jgi:hypothetical protein
MNNCRPNAPYSPCGLVRCRTSGAYTELFRPARTVNQKAHTRTPTAALLRTGGIRKTENTGKARRAARLRPSRRSMRIAASKRYLLRREQDVPGELDEHLRKIGADQIAALVQVSGVPFVAVAPKIGHPLAHIPAVAVLREELGDAVAALARASRAFDAEHMQLTSDVAEGEEGLGHGYILPLLIWVRNNKNLV